MAGINSGILQNAYPISAQQIKELENKVLANKGVVAYLDETNKVCFAMSCGADAIMNIAWHNAYELTNENSTVVKKSYTKTGLKTYVLNKCEIQTENYTVTENEFGGLTYCIGGTK